MKKPSCPPRGRDIAGHVGKIKNPGLLRARHTGLGPTALGPSATELWMKTNTSIFCATTLLTGRDSGRLPVFREAFPDLIFTWPSSEAWQAHHQHADLNINYPASSPAAAPGTLWVLFSRSVVFDTLPSWTAARQAPPSMGFPGRSTAVGCHFLLQRIYLTQGSSRVSDISRRVLYHCVTWEPRGDYRPSKSVMTLLGVQHRGWKPVPAPQTLVITPAQRAALSAL